MNHRPPQGAAPVLGFGGVPIRGSFPAHFLGILFWATAGPPGSRSGKLTIKHKKRACLRHARHAQAFCCLADLQRHVHPAALTLDQQGDRFV